MSGSEETMRRMLLPWMAFSVLACAAVASYGNTVGAHLLTISTAGAGYGSVTSSDGGIACYVPVPGIRYLVAPDCTQTYATGATIQLEAKPEPGSFFAGWSGGCSGTGACILTLDSDRNTRATFKLAPFKITTTGVSGGIISSAIATVTTKIDIALEDLNKRGSIFLTAWVPTKSLGTVLPSASAIDFKDDFASGLSSWVNHGGTWTTTNGKLIADSDATCTASLCPQADLTLVDAYQPTGDYDTAVDFSKATDVRGNAWTYAQFSLWGSSSQKVSIGIGGGGSPTWGGFQSSISVDIQNWSDGWVVRLPRVSYNYAWNADKPQTATLRKAGRIYALYINGTFLTRFSDDLLAGKGKIGLHAFGPKVYDNFRLRPPGGDDVPSTEAIGAINRMQRMPTPSVAAATTASYALVQWTPTGWALVINGKLVPYVSGVLGELANSQTILSNTDTTQLAGAQFCIGYGTSADAMVAAGTQMLVATIADPNATNTNAGSCLSTSALSYSPTVQKGWNLLGNSLTRSYAVATVWGDIATVNSVWKWDAVAQKWLFYTPAMDAGTLNDYATSMGYGVMTDILPGEGYWINALSAVTLDVQSGTPAELTAGGLVTGWNLVSTGTPIAPSAISAAGISFVSLWAWDNSLSQWFFYSPTLDAQGNNALGNYISSQNYGDFANTRTVGAGTGFWVSR